MYLLLLGLNHGKFIINSVWQTSCAPSQSTPLKLKYFVRVAGKALWSETLYQERQLRPARLHPCSTAVPASPSEGTSSRAEEGGCCPPSAQSLPSWLRTLAGEIML